MSDTIKDELNTSGPNRLPSALNDIAMGDLTALLILRLANTETGVVPAASIATLATTPRTLYSINATAAAVTGEKKLLKGSADAAGVITPVPATGEATWGGGTKVRFAAADAVTAADFKYSKSTDVVPSYLQRSIGEQD